MVWDKETIGQRIRRLREERGLTREGLRKLTDLSEQTINRLETGALQVLGEYLERVAKALTVSEEYLLNGDSHAERETNGLIASLRQKLCITQAEEGRLKEMAFKAIKLRNNARVPLHRLDIESLLMVIRGG